MANPSQMEHNFSVAPQVSHPRSVFQRNHCHKTAFNSGYLIPIYCEEVLPGDTINLRATMFARLQTLKFPIMDNLYLDTFYFFVPNRLLWEHWQQMMGERDTVGEILEPTDYLTPVLGSGTSPVIPVSERIQQNTIHDYMGLPLTVEGSGLANVSALWHRAYNLIYNEWFRDQNLQEKVLVDRSDGPDVTSYTLLRRCKKRDYFTSCLPWPQKGEPVYLPLGVAAPVYGDGHTLTMYNGDIGTAGNLFGLGIYKEADDHNNLGAVTAYPGVTVASGPSLGIAAATEKSVGVITKAIATSEDMLSGLYADIGAATAATINDIRVAFQLQRLLERDARGGTRYIEQIKSQFGVTSPDFRLQRPELLSTSSNMINVHPVQQTSASETGSPQGKLSAYALSASNNGFSKSFVEHGVILGIAEVRADITYQLGLARMFTRRTRLDYYLPVLANLGEQAVLKQEIQAIGTDTAVPSVQDMEVFGYQERWAEYRYKNSLITGAMRSQYTGGSLDVWHLAQEFDNTPDLDETFIVDNPPVDRVIAVTNEPQIICDMFFEQRHARVMPTYSVPGLIDHL